MFRNFILTKALTSFMHNNHHESFDITSLTQHMFNSIMFLMIILMTTMIQHSIKKYKYDVQVENHSQRWEVEDMLRSAQIKRHIHWQSDYRWSHIHHKTVIYSVYLETRNYVMIIVKEADETKSSETQFKCKERTCILFFYALAVWCRRHRWWLWLSVKWIQKEKEEELCREQSESWNCLEVFHEE